jgi:hypothetical protein
MQQNILSILPVPGNMIFNNEIDLPLKSFKVFRTKGCHNIPEANLELLTFFTLYNITHLGIMKPRMKGTHEH